MTVLNARVHVRNAMIQPSPCFLTPFPPGGGDVFFDVGRRCGADAGLNDHCRHRRRRIIITLTVIATGIRTERHGRSEEHTSELQSLMRTSYAVICLKKTTKMSTEQNRNTNTIQTYRQHTND